MNFLTLPEEQFSSRGVIFLMLIAFAFSMLVRMIWVYQFAGEPSFYWNNQLMINTNDGYFFASGAQHYLQGVQNELNPRIPGLLDYGVVFFTAIAAKILPFSLETIILYVPAVVSSLVVIPMILIGRIYNASYFGFFAALLGSIAWSYYNRTMTGYYDTDMFSAMAPMFILYFLMNAIEHEKIQNALYAALAIMIYPFLYDQGQSIIYAMGLIYMAYMVLFHRKNLFTYQSILLISIALMPLSWYIQLPLLALAYAIIITKELELKVWIGLSLFAVLLFLYFGDVFSLILSKVLSYTIKGSEDGAFHFFAVNQTVREAGQIPFATMANRISGSTYGVVIALVGYILLVIKYRPFILALPLMGIGIFSLWGGLRFTVYAVPVAAMSAVYLFYVVTNSLHNKFIKYVAIATLTAIMIYPNITHIIGYKVPTVFNKSEVAVLDNLKKIASPKDYTITWWDYGYPIWFYSDTSTLIDGGKHNHDNFIVSKILSTDSQQQAANFSRLAVETYVDSNYSIVADKLFSDAKAKGLSPNRYLEMMKEKTFALPHKDRDIYLYLPLRMLNIFPTVNVFSNLDLSTGESYARPFFYQSSSVQNMPNGINLGNGVVVTKDGFLQIGRQKVPLKQIVVAQIDKKGSVQKSVQNLNPMARFNVIFMKSYNKFLVLDDKAFNSLFIQLFVLENYDKNLFEEVIASPLARVYKLKI